MYIINGNYGNPTIALLQWAYENALPAVTVLSVDTGWAATAWNVWMEQVQDYARACDFSSKVTKSRVDFANLVRDRQNFPTQKFQWCAGILKGLPLLDYLDSIDPQCEATILMGKRQLDLLHYGELPEFIEESDHFGGRRVWHPLRLSDDATFYALIKRAGFAPLPHRSLECDPCIHNTVRDFQRLSEQDVLKLQSLEKEMGRSMFELPIENIQQQAKTSVDSSLQNIQQAFYKSCGSPFGCGE